MDIRIRIGASATGTHRAHPHLLFTCPILRNFPCLYADVLFLQRLLFKYYPLPLSYQLGYKQTWYQTVANHIEQVSGKLDCRFLNCLQTTSYTLLRIQIPPAQHGRSSYAHEPLVLICGLNSISVRPLYYRAISFGRAIIRVAPSWTFDRTVLHKHCRQSLSHCNIKTLCSGFRNIPISNMYQFIKRVSKYKLVRTL